MPADPRVTSVGRFLLLYLYVLLLAPSPYLSSSGSLKVYLDWLLLLGALWLARPYWREMAWAKWAILAYAGHVAWTIVASVLNPASTIYTSPIAIVGYTFGASRPLLIFIAFGSLVRGILAPAERAAVAERVWRHFVAIGVAFGALGMAQVFGPRVIHRFFITIWPRRDERVVDPSLYRDFVWPSVTFDGYYHVFGLLTGLLVVVLVAHIAERRKQPAPGWAWLGLMLAAGLVVVSQSRAGLAAAVVGTIAYAVLGGRRIAGRVGLIFAVPLAVLLAIVQFHLVPASVGDRFNIAYALHKFGTMFSVQTYLGEAQEGAAGGAGLSRLVFWQIHINAFLAHPIRGSGHYQAIGDSIYLVLLGQGGLVGIGLWLMAIGLLARQLFRAARRLAGDGAARSRTAFAMLLSLLTGAYGLSVMQGERLGQTFYFLAAITVAAYRPEEAAELAAAAEPAPATPPPEVAPESPRDPAPPPG